MFNKVLICIKAKIITLYLIEHNLINKNLTKCLPIYVLLLKFTIFAENMYDF